MESGPRAALGPSFAQRIIAVVEVAIATGRSRPGAITVFAGESPARRVHCGEICNRRETTREIKPLGGHPGIVELRRRPRVIVMAARAHARARKRAVIVGRGLRGTSPAPGSSARGGVGSKEVRRAGSLFSAETRRLCERSARSRIRRRGGRAFRNNSRGKRH